MDVLVWTEQISGMSEATIDTMMGALQRLKDVRRFILNVLEMSSLIMPYSR